MDSIWIAILLKYVLLAVRVAGFVMVAPVFGWTIAPMRVRLGLALVLTIFFAYAFPTEIRLTAGTTSWTWAVVMIGRESLVGVALGLAAQLLFMAVQQGGEMITLQMGLADAEIIDPVSGEAAQPVSTLLQMIFVLLFLAAGGHQLLLVLLERSYQVFPAGGGINPGALAEGVLQAGSTMLLVATKVAAPALAAFLILSILLSVLARAVPEIDILFNSFPLRVALGLAMAVAMMPTLDNFTAEIGDYMKNCFMRA